MSVRVTVRVRVRDRVRGLSALDALVPLSPLVSTRPSVCALLSVVGDTALAGDPRPIRSQTQITWHRTLFNSKKIIRGSVTREKKSRTKQK